MLIRCTAKLLGEMGIKKVASVSGDSSASLGDWYANMFYTRRRKNVIFMNSRSLFTFICFNVTRQQIKNLGKLFREGLGRAMLDEDLEAGIIQGVINEAQDIKYAETQDKRVLGVMVDHVKNVKFIIKNKPDWTPQELVKFLNRTPLLTYDFRYAISEFNRIIGTKNGKHLST
jgi:hypothetical protein